MIKSLVNYINHVLIVLDDSSSMRGLRAAVIKLVDKQVDNLAEESKKKDQETRISVLIFGTQCKWLVYDKDVLRMPSIKDVYTCNQGSTALIDGTLMGLTDIRKTPEIIGDHAFLTYVVTDGQENSSSASGPALNKFLSDLPANHTIAILVPNSTGVSAAKQYGFPPDNIQVWETTATGVEEMSVKMSAATTNYMAARATGVRGMKNLFNMKPIDVSAVKNKLEPVDPATFETLLVRKYDDGKAIKEFVESWRKSPYVVGSAYYQITKPEKIQPTKVLAVKEVKNGKLYSGPAAREILGLPNHEVKVSPPPADQFIVFAQSTSVNRKLVADTQLIVMV